MTEMGSFAPVGQAEMAPHDGAVANALRSVIGAYDRSSPRSTQVRIGPSEIGEPCARKLAYKVSGFPAPPGDDDHWFSILGTSMHIYLAKAFEQQNDLAIARGDEPPWLIEESVQIRPGLTGTADLCHLPTGTAIDHKQVGSTSYKQYRSKGPSSVYKVQIHTYGVGLWNRGVRINRVAIAFYPRFDTLKSLYVWSEPFNPQIVVDALNRLDNIVKAITILNPATDPIKFSQFPRTPSADCRYCPWLKPGPDSGAACPGNLTV